MELKDMVNNDEEKASLKENSSHHSHHYESLDSSVHWKETQTKSRKAHLIKNIVLEEDLYALTWVSLRDDIWNNKQIGEYKIDLTPPNHFWIQMIFITYIVGLLMTIFILMNDVFTKREYIASDWQIIILRVTLVSFSQKNLSPEFFQGLFLLRYSVRYYHEFTHHHFAIFVGFSQMFITMISFFCVILFVCMESDALTLVVEFAGLSVISRLDNWIGEVIMCSKLNVEKISKNTKKYKIKKINKKMSVFNKMAMISEEDLVYIDDQNNIHNAHWTIRFMEFIINLLPWSYILPFITIFFNYVLPFLNNFK